MSFSSMAFAFPPRGFLVKNANVFQPFAIICFAMAVYPFEDEVWFPIYKVVIKKSPLLVSEKLLTEAPKVLILSLNDKY